MIKLSDTIRPKADDARLRSIIEAAWAEYAESIKAPLDSLELRESITRQTEALNPPADMKILQCYGYAESVDKVLISRRNTSGYYANLCYVNLTRPVLQYTKAPKIEAFDGWGDDHNEYGYRPAYWATMSEQERAEAMQLAERAQAHRLAPEFVPAFAALAEAQHAQRHEYMVASAFPARHKKIFGEYPTWEQFAVEYPVTGAWLRKSLESGPVIVGEFSE